MQMPRRKGQSLAQDLALGMKGPNVRGKLPAAENLAASISENIGETGALYVIGSAHIDHEHGHSVPKGTGRNDHYKTLWLCRSSVLKCGHPLAPREANRIKAAAG
jgi:hypothetical protein